MNIRTVRLAAVALLWVCAAGVRAQNTDDLAIGIVNNNPAMVMTALDAGASVNVDLGEGRTPLITAAMFGRPEIVKLLLERGANPDLDSDGSIGNALTAAFFAMNGIALLGNMDRPDPAQHATALEVLRLIAARHPDFDYLVRRAGAQRTALMLAADAGAADVVKVLLDAGASPGTVNSGRYTALDCAADPGLMWLRTPGANHAEVIRLLLAAGAQPNHKGADGLTPLDRARRNGNAAIVSAMTAGRG